MFRLKTAETLPLTPELAARHLAMTPSPTERPTDDSRLKYLREAAVAGEFINCNWAIAILNGEPVRMNGQHSAKVLTELNGEFPKGLYAHIDTFDVDEKGDLAHLFRQFDSRKSSRSAGDVAGAYQGLHPDLLDVERGVAKLAIEGVAWAWRHVEGTKVLAGDNAYTLFDNATLHPFVKWMGEVLSMKTPELRASSIAAAMFSTYEVNPEAADEFWRKVAKGGNGEPGDPATVLDAWLTKAKSNGKELNLKPGQIYQGCIHAWNAFRTSGHIKGDTIKVRVDKGFLTPEH